MLATFTVLAGLILFAPDSYERQLARLHRDYARYAKHNDQLQNEADELNQRWQELCRSKGRVTGLDKMNRISCVDPPKPEPSKPDPVKPAPAKPAKGN